MEIPYTADELVKECMRLFEIRHECGKLMDLSDVTKQRLFVTHCGHRPDTRSILFYLPYDEISMPLIDFTNKYLILAMEILLSQKEPETRVDADCLETVEGIFCGSYSSHSAEIRVIIKENPVPAGRGWPRGWVKEFYDPHRDELIRAELCPAVRIDLLLRRDLSVD